MSIPSASALPHRTPRPSPGGGQRTSVAHPAQCTTQGGGGQPDACTGPGHATMRLPHHLDPGSATRPRMTLPQSRTRGLGHRPSRRRHHSPTRPDPVSTPNPQRGGRHVIAYATPRDRRPSHPDNTRPSLVTGRRPAPTPGRREGVRRAEAYQARMPQADPVTHTPRHTGPRRPIPARPGRAQPTDQLHDPAPPHGGKGPLKPENQRAGTPAQSPLATSRIHKGR